MAIPMNSRNSGWAADALSACQLEPWTGDDGALPISPNLPGSGRLWIVNRSWIRWPVVWMFRRFLNGSAGGFAGVDVAALCAYHS